MKRVLLIAAVMALGLIGSAQAQGRITVWTHYPGPELTWLTQTAEAFTRATGTRVEIVSVPFGDIQNKFILGAPQGQAADLVVSIPHDWVGAMATAGVLEPMGRYVTRDFLQDLSPVAVEALTFRNHLFALPMFAESVALIYNRRLVRTPPRTWDDFLRVAQEHTRGDRFGFLYDLGNPYFNFGWFAAYGATVFGRDARGAVDTREVRLGGDAGNRAVTFIRDLRFRHRLIPEGVDYGVAHSAFMEGALAMILNGPWAIGDYRRAGIDFGIAPLPNPPGGGQWRPFVGVQGVAMNAFSRNKTAAANFAKLLVSPRSQVAFSRAGGRVPVSRQAVEQLRADPVVVGFSATIAIGTPMPNVPEMGKVWGPWGNALAQAVLRADTDIPRIVAAMAEEINRGLGGR
jgi:arabinogalactan oligomer/maltooligosaccharide transport system substrate-binding protein